MACFTVELTISTDTTITINTRPYFLLAVILAKNQPGDEATSTPVERVFSMAGLIVSQLRASLTPEHVDTLVLLNKNMDLNLK